MLIVRIGVNFFVDEVDPSTYLLSPECERGDSRNTMLDATKAFYRVEYCKLVRLFLVKNVPPIVIRLLLQMHLFHFTRVAWNGTFSKRFCVSNGVRKGTIISPILFCVYFDVLLGNLS